MGIVQLLYSLLILIKVFSSSVVEVIQKDYMQAVWAWLEAFDI